MGEVTMTSYEVRTGRHAVAVLTASTASEAVGEYLRGLGCRHDEIVRMGTDAASWRGAVYRAVPVGGKARRAA
jgi:hypothetical protein